MKCWKAINNLPVYLHLDVLTTSFLLVQYQLLRIVNTSYVDKGFEQFVLIMISLICPHQNQIYFIFGILLKNLVLSRF